MEFLDKLNRAEYNRTDTFMCFTVSYFKRLGKADTYYIINVWKCHLFFNTG